MILVSKDGNAQQLKKREEFIGIARISIYPPGTILVIMMAMPSH